MMEPPLEGALCVHMVCTFQILYKCNTLAHNFVVAYLGCRVIDIIVYSSNTNMKDCLDASTYLSEQIHMKLKEQRMKRETETMRNEKLKKEAARLLEEGGIMR